MDPNDNEMRSLRKTKLLWLLIGCCCGILINMAFALLADALRLPSYLISVGSVITAAVCGPLPGMLTAFLSNLLCGLFDSFSTYYSGLSVLVALVAAVLANRGWFRKAGRIVLSILIFAGMGVVLGAGITLLTDMFNFDSGNVSSLAERFYATGALSEAASIFLAGIIVDTADKTLAVLLAALIKKRLPAPLAKKLRFSGWAQAPLDSTTNRKLRRQKVRFISLRFKIPALIAVAGLLVAVGAIASSYRMYQEDALEEHIRSGSGIAKLAAATIRGDDIENYFEKGASVPSYAATEKQLNRIFKSSTDIQYLYVYQIREDGCYVVFDMDTPELEGGELGDFIDFDEAFMPYVPALLAGEPIEPIISDETFGWLLTFYEPVYDSLGICRCYAAADISMQLLSHNSISFLVESCSKFLGFFLVVLGLGLWIAENNITLPINSLDLVSGSVSYDGEKNREAGLQRIRDLKIRSGDEIENLYRSLMASTEDTVRYITEAEHQAEIIEKMQNGLIILMADLVESRDKSTGDHIRKTAAYVRIIIEQLREDGIYADRLTDEYMAQVTNLAPLHDIGKIHIPDAVLNKAGKLTDEEYAMMKGHAAAGFDILVNATDIVPESDYLDEAQNLAAYHHERWDGKGYPKGLAGEEIPLSARIMAVADVFDALVSRRCYKKPFPIETAIDIIKEGAGTQFDPNIVEAFLHAIDKVCAVAEEHSKMEGGEQNGETAAPDKPDA